MGVLVQLLASTSSADTLLDFEEIDSLPSYTTYFGQGFAVKPLSGPGSLSPTLMVGVEILGAPGIGAYNGTNVLRALGNTVPYLTREDGRTFDFHGFDISEYSTVFAEPLEIHVRGEYVGGEKILAIFVTDGIVDGSNGVEDDFEHVTLGPAWRNLESVTFVAVHGFALDNLELGEVNLQVPALSPTSHLVAAGAILALALSCVRTRWPAPRVVH